MSNSSIVWVALGMAVLLVLPARASAAPATLAAPVASAAPDAALEREARAIAPQAVLWRRDIHEHPELGYHESRTAALVARHLASLGMTVTTGIAHTGVIGVLHGSLPGPTVALDRKSVV